MAYHIEVYPEVAEQVRALPAGAVRELDQVFEVLRLTPWNGDPYNPANGDPYNPANPDGWMRTWVFDDGCGIVTYLVLDDQDRVDILNVTWIG